MRGVVNFMGDVHSVQTSDDDGMWICSSSFMRKEEKKPSVVGHAWVLASPEQEMAWGLAETAGNWCRRVILHGEELKLLSRAMHEGVKQALHGTESLGEQECPKGV